MFTDSDLLTPKNSFASNIVEDNFYTYDGCDGCIWRFVIRDERAVSIHDYIDKCYVDQKPPYITFQDSAIKHILTFVHFFSINCFSTINLLYLDLKIFDKIYEKERNIYCPTFEILQIVYPNNDIQYTFHLTLNKHVH